MVMRTSRLVVEPCSNDVQAGQQDRPGMIKLAGFWVPSFMNYLLGQPPEVVEAAVLELAAKCNKVDSAKAPQKRKRKAKFVDNGFDEVQERRAQRQRRRLLDCGCRGVCCDKRSLDHLTSGCEGDDEYPDTLADRVEADDGHDKSYWQWSNGRNTVRLTPEQVEAHLSLA
jgi:hypothetical protein